MKVPIQILILSLIASSADAEFRTWTRSDGKTAELDLVSVTDSAGVKTGEFKMRNGKTVSLASNTLSEADAKLLADWKPAAATPSAPATPSAFDEILSGNLKKLSGKSVITCDLKGNIVSRTESIPELEKLVK